MSMRSEYLKRVPLLRELNDQEIGKLAGRTREEVFMPGAPIVEIGEPGDCLYILLDGNVQVLYPARSGEFELARMGPGDFFGEMALLNNQPRSATVRALKPVRALALDKADFREIIAESPTLALKLLEVMSQRIRYADEQISGLSDKALRDPLTSLLNRRAFHERLIEECERSRRYGEHFSLILLDLDRFKSINDTFGHDAGDAILVWVGRMLTDHTRVADTPFRIGGEEFAIIAPATGMGVAHTVAQRLLDTLAEAKPPLEVQLRLTASAGFAACPDNGFQTDALFRAADQALIRAKQTGRSRACGPEN
ncbi:MAG: GGDEF domain-containing protein [Gemmatimonadetes bacterium]|nr:GGDEF domain-containing protein [Gemmatimonadota bacterium]